MENKDQLIDIYIKIYDTQIKLNAIKNLIKDSTTVENGTVKISNIFFTDNLINLIKYTDEEFYNELKCNN